MTTEDQDRSVDALLRKIAAQAATIAALRQDIAGLKAGAPVNHGHGPDRSPRQAGEVSVSSDGVVTWYSDDAPAWPIRPSVGDLWDDGYVVRRFGGQRWVRQP